MSDVMLDARLASGPLPLDEALRLGIAIGRALAEAHARDVVHGDFTPASVRVRSDGAIDIVDMPRGRRITVELNPSGDPTIAALESLAKSRSHVRKADVLLGELAYKTSDQLRGEHNAPADDIFALGAVLYEMLSGRRAFPGTSRAELTREIAIGKPKPLTSVAPAVPESLAKVVAKCLAPSRKERYASMDEAVGALDAVRSATPQKRPTAKTETVQAIVAPVAPAKRPTIAEPVGRRRFSPVMFLAIAASVIAVIAVAALVLRRSGPRTDPLVVLVTPLEARGDTSEYLGRAFAEALAVSLALTGTIKVLPVPSPAELGTTAMDRAAVARAHGAAHIVTGAVTRDGDRLEASINLIATAENHIVWGTRDTGGDLSSLAFELSREIAVQLGASIPKLYDYVANLTGSDAMAREADTGLALASIRGGDIPRALAATERLVTQFPNELAAQALRTQALLLAWDADPNPANATAFNDAVGKLELLEPRNPYAQFYRAYLAYGRGDFKAALDQFASLLEREDFSPAARAWVMRYRALVLGATGDRAGSLRAIEDALAIDPANAWTLAALASSLNELGRYDEALERARQAALLNPLAWRNHVTLGLALVQLQRFSEAASAFATGCSQSNAQFACALEAVALHHAGKVSEASVVAERATRLTDSTWGTYNLACYYAIAGNKKEALTYLSRSVELGLSNTSFETDTDLKTIANTPELAQLAARVRQRTAH